MVTQQETVGRVRRVDFVSAKRKKKGEKKISLEQMVLDEDLHVCPLFKESERGAIEGNETRRMECGSEVSGSRTKDDVLGQLSLSARCGGVL